MSDTETIESLRTERDAAVASLDARWEHSDHLTAKYYRRMRDAEREMHARELHHFEEEQKSARLEAAIREALEASRHGQTAIYRVARILSSALEQTPADCNCGFGGEHLDNNPRCRANTEQTPEAVRDAS